MINSGLGTLENFSSFVSAKELVCFENKHKSLQDLRFN